MENELVRNLENGMNLDDQMKQAEMFIKSGFFPRHIDTVAKAIVIIQKGKELGLPKTEALSKISVINGQPCVKVETLLGLAQAKGIIEDLKVTDFPTHCEVMMKRKWQSPFICKFGDADALAMGLSGRDNYKKQKSVMYRWRALAMALRVVCPDAIGGLYLAEEIADGVDVSENPKTNEVFITEIHETPKDIIPQEVLSPKEENSALKAIDISDDQLGHWVIPFGKYKGKRLIEIIGEVTETGKAKGYEYLQWLAESATTPECKDVVTRFLKVMDDNK